jgi:type IV secretory pathway VirB9-like protein
MKKLIPIAALLACTVSWNALALSPEPMLPQDSRIKILPYDETDVYTITTKPGYQTNVVFGRSEEIQAISVGDRSFWQIVPNGNRLFIRPMNEDVSTNMTVLTNRHSYQFDLKSIAMSEEEGNIYVAKFTYPDQRATPPAMPFQQAVPPAAPAPAPAAAPVALQNEPSAPAAPTFVPAPEPAPSYLSAAPGSVKPPYTPPPCFPPECVPPGAKSFNPNEAPPYVPTATGPGITQPVGNNFSYTFAGPDDLAPLQVYDDGKSTYISYRQTSEPLPNIYLIGHDGVERPTTYYIKGNAMVVDNVAPQMALKSSSGTVYIYNELLSPR